MDSKFSTISIVIPVYNEEKYITHTLERVLKADTLGLKKELVIIDDKSKDDTWKNLNAYVKKLKKGTPIKLLQQQKNQGKGAALKRAFQETTGDIVLVQDADMEYNPDDYTTLLEPFLHYDADVVYGSRFISNKPHRVLYYWHCVANYFLTLLSNFFTNLNLTDMETGYKVFKGQLIREIAPKLECQRFGFEPEITARIAKKRHLTIFEVGISYWGRTYEDGKKIGVVDGIRALWEIVYYNLFVK